MREVIFRGKRIHNGEWVEGDLVHQYWLEQDYFMTCAIRYKIGLLYSFPMEVNPDTVGQFTGLLDKNGNKIFEGDWCRACYRDINGFHYIQGRIVMDEYMWCLDTLDESDEFGIYSINRLHDFEVLTNIHDNPELINQ